MGSLGLFSARCSYCRSKIADENEHKRAVKRVGYIGTKEMSFCGKEHADAYEKEVEAASKQSKSSSGGCC